MFCFCSKPYKTTTRFSSLFLRLFLQKKLKLHVSQNDYTWITWLCFGSAQKPTIRANVGAGLKMHSWRSNVLLFCFWLKVLFDALMSFCSASVSKLLENGSMSSVLSLSLSQKAENIKIHQSTSYGVFLIFEYLYISPYLFCLRYSNMYTTLKGSLLKMSKGLDDVLLLSGSFSGFINGSELRISKK